MLFINFFFIGSNDCLVEIKIVVMSVNKNVKIIYWRFLIVVLYNFSMGYVIMVCEGFVVIFWDLNIGC